MVDALEVYLKFRKVVPIKLQNDRYKEQLIQRYEQQGEGLTVRFIKGYKSPKWPDHKMWEKILHKNYTE